MKFEIKKLAILTSGGDAPGMNNAIRAIVKKAQTKSIDTFLVFGGYKGLYENDIKPAASFDIDAYIAKGGTFIKSARFPAFKEEATYRTALKNLAARGIDALVVIGGDGSYRGAQLLHKLGVKTVCLPGTIDNDIASSDFAIGYDTALNSIVSNIDRIKDTALSHNRAIIVEVMGRDCGDLALFSALATGANLVVTNQNKQTIAEIGRIVKAQSAKGKQGIIVIVSEHLYSDIAAVAKAVEKISKVVTRGVVLGHTQRGGTPSAFERIIASRMGMKAIDLLTTGKSGLAIGIVNNKIKATPILEALSISHVDRRALIAAVNELNQT